MKKISIFLCLLIFVSWSLIFTARAGSTFYYVKAKGGLYVYDPDDKVLEENPYNPNYPRRQKIWTDKPWNLNITEGVGRAGDKIKIKYSPPPGRFDKNWTGWVVSKYLKRVTDFCNIRFIVPLSESVEVILVHGKPGYFSELRSGEVHVDGGWRKGAVLITGRIVNGWVEILGRKVCFPDRSWVFSEDHIFPGWIWGEYVGVAVDSEYIKFRRPVIYQTLGYNVHARGKPIIISKILGTYQRKGFKVKIIGQKGSWLLTDKGKWVFKELLKLVSD